MRLLRPVVLFLALAFLILPLVVPSALVLAQTQNTHNQGIATPGLVPCGESSAASPYQASECGLCDFIALIQNIINYLIVLALPVSAALFAWAGILLFTAGDKIEKRTQAKKIFQNVVVGLLIALAGYLIIQTILNAIVNTSSGGLFQGGFSFSFGSCAADSARDRSETITSLFTGLQSSSNTLAPATTPTGTTGGTSGTATPGGSCGAAGCTASGNGSSVTYTNPDGTQQTNTGGTVAWRNNNPGNMIAGAGGITPVGYNNGFAVFASYQDGYNAMIANLQSANYQSLTIAGAISRWAPAASGNDPVGYANSISQQTGLSSNTPMSSLTATQLASVANAIQNVEGYSSGTVTKTSSSTS
jgi:hypothetical protein